MPPGQDDNPFGAPRGAWGRQPPTTFGLSVPVRRVARPSNQIRVPAPTPTARNILTGGLVPQARPAPAPPPPEHTDIAPETPSAPPEPAPVSEPVLARATSAPPRRGLPFPPVAGIGLVIAAIVVAGLLLFLKTPTAPQAVPAPAPAQAAPSPAPAIIAESPPVAEPAAPAAPVAAAPSPRPARVVRPEVQAAAPITPPPLEAPPIVSAPPPPAPAPAVPPPTDPDAPMTTRLPGPQ